MLKTEIPFPDDNDISRLFAPLAEQPWSVWLDSGTAETKLARYDIIVAEPSMTLVSVEGTTEIRTAEGTVSESQDDPFDVLRNCLPSQPAPCDSNIPFCGGALGYFSYDLARRLEVLPDIARNDLAMPLLAVGIYDWALVCDRLTRRCWLVSSRYQDENSPQWQRLLAIFTLNQDSDLSPPRMQARSPASSNLSFQSYSDAFARIQHYLEEGDCYQVNFAQRFGLDVTGSPWSGYCQLRQHGAGPFSAYINTPHGQIMCTSPERFIRLHERNVETRPIKGTRRRDKDSDRDHQLRDELAASPKDRAENLMIVDLLRNDLGKSCKTGTVRVPELFAVETFATVHHLVSSVTCELDEAQDALSLLRGCFPGGSITGAPKLRAMEIIEELEPHRRGVYCGSIGYIGFDGTMDSNIVIRTAIHQDGRLYYSAGGGIVRDSSCDDEYQESFDKAAAFLHCFAEET